MEFKKKHWNRNQPFLPHCRDKVSGKHPLNAYFARSLPRSRCLSTVQNPWSSCPLNPHPSMESTRRNHPFLRRSFDCLLTHSCHYHQFHNQWRTSPNPSDGTRKLIPAFPDHLHRTLYTSPAADPKTFESTQSGPHSGHIDIHR